MKNKEYWVKRAEQNLITQEIKAGSYLEKLLDGYNTVKSNIDKELSVFYIKYAENNSISFTEARKLLSGDEIKKFHDDLESYIRLAKDSNLSPEWMKELENMSIRARVRRIEALQMNIKNQIEILSGKYKADTNNLLKDIYSDSYYRGIWTIQTGTSIGITINKLNTEAIEKIVKTKWLGENYSDRIYKNKQKLVNELEKELKHSFIRGDSISNTSKRLYKKLDISYSNAVRLVRTESNYISNQAQIEGYIRSGVVSEYEYLATLDKRTSSICRELDSQVFKLSEIEVGVNYPPAHANCRSTTIPYFSDEKALERIVRNLKGKTYYVDGNMSYQQWYDTFVL